ncbi:MAG: hypothetical protein NW205_04425 [Hyphomicrobiaceae bacterium]|nr:hypothetical protein [Hyphomicrobiaceae bacterium]
MTRFALLFLAVACPALTSCALTPKRWADGLESAGLMELDEDYYRSVVTGYQKVEFFDLGRPIGGWTETANADGGFTIKALGSPYTPRDRTRDIALARVGEKGVELKREVFCITKEESGFTCKGLRYTYTTTVTVTEHGHQPFTTMTVGYFDKEPLGQRYCLSSQATIDHLKKKLDTTIPTRPEVEKHIADARAFCLDAIANRRSQ